MTTEKNPTDLESLVALARREERSGRFLLATLEHGVMAVARPVGIGAGLGILADFAYTLATQSPLSTTPMSQFINAGIFCGFTKATYDGVVLLIDENYGLRERIIGSTLFVAGLAGGAAAIANDHPTAHHAAIDAAPVHPTANANLGKQLSAQAAASAGLTL